MKFFVHVALLFILLPTVSYAEDNHQHGAHENAVGVEALSDDLRHLLSEEMKALEKGMMSIIPAFISGSWGQIETIAGKIKSSYILKQSLTKNQKRELHTKLPPAFIEKDKRFHYLAGMLEHAAKMNKIELINFYFSEMNESCVGCHTVYATHKFPALLSTEIKQEHMH